MSLWVHGPVRPNTLTIIFQCGPTVNGVWTCMRSDHCRGPVSKHEFYSSTWFKRDRSFRRKIKWWNRNAFQSGLFYCKERKYWGDGRQLKEAFYKGLTIQSIFPVFRRKSRTNNFKQEYYFCSLTTIVIWNYPPLSLKSHMRLVTTQGRGRGGRETWPVHHFVFFMHRRGGLHFVIGLCPKGSPIKIKN